MKCPNCSAVANDGAPECQACGLVFAKWRERREKERREAAEALKALESPAPARSSNPWTGRLIAGLVVAWWMIVLAIYYFHGLRRRQEAAPRRSAEFSGRGS